MADRVVAGLRTYSPRPGPMDQEPGARLGKALSLLDDIDRATRRLQPLLRTVNRMTGLSCAQVSSLLAFADDGQMPMGTTQGSTPLTELARQGLVAPGEAPPDQGPGGPAWRLTDAGRAALGQVQGLRIRALGTLVTTLGDSQVDAIRAAIHGIVEALEVLPMAADDDPPRTLP